MDRNEYFRRWRKNNPRRRLNTRLKSQYGITLEEFEQMSREQDHLCAVCGKPETAYKRLSVDHCHKTKRIRGLLCHRCNKGLGFFDDDPDKLMAAIRYICEN